jgi:hypothetical protein
MRSRSLSAGAALAVAVAALCLPAAPGYAASLRCGDLVTASVVLDRDLSCAETGLVVASSDVVVDLDGHTIAGSGVGAGVLVSGGAARIEVRDGSVRGFASGVVIEGGGTDADASSQTHDIGIHDLGVSANAGDGIVVGVDFVHTVALDRNRIRGNGGTGISVGPFTAPVTVTGNRIVGNGEDGLLSSVDAVRVVHDNLVARNSDDGVEIGDSVAQVTGNKMMRNGRHGLSIFDSIAFFIPLYVVADNVADRNGIGGMIAAADLPTPPPAGTGNAAKHNGVFDCVLIVCARNRGLARSPAGPASDAAHHTRIHRAEHGSTAARPVVGRRSPDRGAAPRPRGRRLTGR